MASEHKEIVVFRQIAEAIGSTLEDVCNLQEAERKELAIVLGFKEDYERCYERKRYLTRNAVKLENFDESRRESVYNITETNPTLHIVNGSSNMISAKELNNTNQTYNILAPPSPEGAVSKDQITKFQSTLDCTIMVPPTPDPFQSGRHHVSIKNLPVVVRHIPDLLAQKLVTPLKKAVPSPQSISLVNKLFTSNTQSVDVILARDDLPMYGGKLPSVDQDRVKKYNNFFFNALTNLAGLKRSGLFHGATETDHLLQIPLNLLAVRSKEDRERSRDRDVVVSRRFNPEVKLSKLKCFDYGEVIGRAWDSVESVSRTRDQVSCDTEDCEKRSMKLNRFQVDPYNFYSSEDDDPKDALLLSNKKKDSVIKNSDDRNCKRFARSCGVTEPYSHVNSEDEFQRSVKKKNGSRRGRRGNRKKLFNDKTDYMNDTANLETDEFSAPKFGRDTKFRHSDVVKRTIDNLKREGSM